MAKALTADIVRAKSKCDNLSLIKNLNLWGNEIEDVKLLRQMPNVEVLSLSVNNIKSLKEFAHCTKLQELYLRKNNITDLSEIRYLANLNNLRVLWLWDNPCAESRDYRAQVIKALPQLVKLDNNVVTPEEKAEAEQLNYDSNNGGGNYDYNEPEEIHYERNVQKEYSAGSPIGRGGDYARDREPSYQQQEYMAQPQSRAALERERPFAGEGGRLGGMLPNPAQPSPQIGGRPQTASQQSQQQARYVKKNTADVNSFINHFTTPKGNNIANSTQ